MKTVLSAVVFYALLYGAIYWSALLAFCLPLRHKERFAARVAAALVPLLFLTPVYSCLLRGLAPRTRAALTPLVFGVSVLLIGLLVHFCVQIDWMGAFYCAVWCVLAAQGVNELWYLLLRAGGKRFPAVEALSADALAAGVAGLLFAVGCCVLLRFTAARSMPYNGTYHVGPRQLGSALMLGGMFMWLFVQLFSQNRMSWLPSSVSIQLLCQFYCLTLMYLQTELFKKSAMQKEMDTLNLLYDRQRQQYQIARQNVQIINRRCHELKVQIADLRRLAPDTLLQQSLNEAETAARLYDANANTGNEVLDVVLTEKTLLCESRKIQLNAVADGSCLKHFEPGDLYALFANALDHAIESAIQVQEQSRRVIDLLVCVRQGFVVINVISPERPPAAAETRATNYELKVLRKIVQKYSGTLTTETKSGFFAVKILFSHIQK